MCIRDRPLPLPQLIPLLQLLPQPPSCLELNVVAKPVVLRGGRGPGRLHLPLLPERAQYGGQQRPE
eukprot:2212983-Heterocapsa_arctica.AAC.1